MQPTINSLVSVLASSYDGDPTITKQELIDVIDTSFEGPQSVAAKALLDAKIAAL